jgi:hypothetical protein
MKNLLVDTSSRKHSDGASLEGREKRSDRLDSRRDMSMQDIPEALLAHHRTVGWQGIESVSAEQLRFLVGVRCGVEVDVVAVMASSARWRTVHHRPLKDLTIRM